MSDFCFVFFYFIGTSVTLWSQQETTVRYVGYYTMIYNALFWNSQAQLHQQKHIENWLILSGNSSRNLHHWSVVNMPYFQLRFCRTIWFLSNNQSPLYPILEEQWLYRFDHWWPTHIIYLITYFVNTLRSMEVLARGQDSMISSRLPVGTCRKRRVHKVIQRLLYSAYSLLAFCYNA